MYKKDEVIRIDYLYRWAGDGDLTYETLKESQIEDYLGFEVFDLCIKNLGLESFESISNNILNMDDNYILSIVDRYYTNKPKKCLSYDDLMGNFDNDEIQYKLKNSIKNWIDNLTDSKKIYFLLDWYSFESQIVSIRDRVGYFCIKKIT